MKRPEGMGQEEYRQARRIQKSIAKVAMRPVKIWDGSQGQYTKKTHGTIGSQPPGKIRI